MQRDRLYSLLSAALIAVCVLATRPVLEMGEIDDWAYMFVAKGLALTGHIVYNGGREPMIGVQAYWGALLIRIFGFSFTLLRLSTVPFAAGCGFLLYRLGRSAGLNPSFALFGTATVTLSPLFIPLAATFMTDVPSLFFWLACVYCSLCAARTSSAARAVCWLAAAAAAGIAGGTVRQIVWIVPLLAVPAAAYIRRRERRVVIAAGLLWCGTVAAEALCLRWFLRQPYIAQGGFVSHGPIGWFPEWLKLWKYVVEAVLAGGVACLIFVLPVLTLFLADWRKGLRAPVTLAMGLAIPGACIWALVWRLQQGLFVGDIVTVYGILDREIEAMGLKPEILPPAVCMALALTVTISAAFTLTGLAASGRRGGNWSPGPGDPEDTGRSSLRRFAFVFGPSVALYAVAVLCRVILFDRYLIPLLAFLVIPMLWRYQRTGRGSPSALGWAAVGAFALYGIATTHDFLAAGRARLQAASVLTGAGIPRTHITAGLEYDGWTQVELFGHVYVPGGPEQAPPERKYPVATPFWAWYATPGVTPEYFVTYTRLAGLRDGQFPPIHFRAWLPPFHRAVFTQTADPITE